MQSGRQTSWESPLRVLPPNASRVSGPMAEESTTPDLVELARRSIEAGSSGDFDAMLSFFAPDGVWDMSPLGMGRFEGRTPIRAFLADWHGAPTGYGVD